MSRKKFKIRRNISQYRVENEMNEKWEDGYACINIVAQVDGDYLLVFQDVEEENNEQYRPK